MLVDKNIHELHLIFLVGYRCLHCQDMFGEPYVHMLTSTLMDVTVSGPCVMFGGEWTPFVCLI